MKLLTSYKTQNRNSKQQGIHRPQTPPPVLPPTWGVAPPLGGDVEQPSIMCNYDVIHKLEIHNTSLRRQKRTDPRP